MRNPKRGAGLRFCLVAALVVATAWFALPIGLRELLEPTAYAANFQVINTNDSGSGSMRQAILDANANSGTDVIRVDPALSGQTVMLLTALPPVTESVDLIANGLRLDGSVTGSANGLVLSGNNIFVQGLSVRNFGAGFHFGGDNIRLDRVTAVDNVVGVQVMPGADNNMVRFSEIDGNQSGIFVEAARGFQLLASQVTGNGGNGIELIDTVDTTIRGNAQPMPGEPPSVIGGNNLNGVCSVRDWNLTLTSYYIGINEDGTAAQPNGRNGVKLDDTRDSQIGAFSLADLDELLEQPSPGTDVSWDGLRHRLSDLREDANVISGNDGSGVVIAGNGAVNNVVGGNFIGTDGNGAVAVGNQVDGLRLENGANNNRIIVNLITANAGSGISVAGAPQNDLRANGIGVLLEIDGNPTNGNGGAGVKITDSSGTRVEGNEIANNGLIVGSLQGGGVVVVELVPGTANSNFIIRNRIYENAGLNIDLNANGEDIVDGGDGDGGANNTQNTLNIAGANTNVDTTILVGRFDSLPNTEFSFEFYADFTNPNPLKPKLESFIGNVTRATDANGNLGFTFVPTDANGNNIVLPARVFVTATATKLDASGNPTDTSEASRPTPVTGTSDSTDISVTKSASPVGLDNNGFLVTYTIQIENLGTIPASNVTLREQPFEFFESFVAPPGWTVTTPRVGEFGIVTARIPSLPPTGGTPVTFTLVMRNPFVGFFINRAFASTSTPESNPNNNFVQVITRIPERQVSGNDVTVSEVVASADVQISSFGSPTNRDITVDFDTQDGTAQAGRDYEPKHGTVTIPAGETTANISIPIINNTLIDGERVFLVNLSNPTDATIMDAQITVTIMDNDGGPTPTPSPSPSPVVLTTPVGTDVNVQGNGVSATFSQVTTAGMTTIAPIDPNSAGTLPSGYIIFGSSVAFDITTTASFAPPIDLCFNLPSVNDPTTFANLRVLRSGNGTLVDRTLSRDFATRMVCARTTALSPFLVALATQNPVDGTDPFVLQHYRDFLDREPDAGGLQFWSNEIEVCGTDVPCREVKRINVSAAFFLSIEFQETGYLVYRFFKTAYGDSTSTGVSGTVPIIRREEFLPDTERISQGVQVGIGDWQQTLEANKQAYALEFVQRQRFLDAFPVSLTPAQFVDQLNQRAGGVLSMAERDQVIADLTANNTMAGRATAVRRVAEDPELRQAEFNRAFVLMQYYGYLRRNPDEGQDTNFGGWKFWLDKLDQFNGNFIQAEMVKAFISSGEYRDRFFIQP